jgi:hypothetical protein
VILLIFASWIGRITGVSHQRLAKRTIFLFIYSHVCALFGSFLPPTPFPYHLPSFPLFQAGPVLPLSLILLKKSHKPNKEDKTFLLVELRIAIQKYS